MSRTLRWMCVFYANEELFVSERGLNCLVGLCILIDLLDVLRFHECACKESISLKSSQQILLGSFINSIWNGFNVLSNVIRWCGIYAIILFYKYLATPKGEILFISSARSPEVRSPRLHFHYIKRTQLLSPLTSITKWDYIKRKIIHFCQNNNMNSLQHSLTPVNLVNQSTGLCFIYGSLI